MRTKICSLVILLLLLSLGTVNAAGLSDLGSIASRFDRLSQKFDHCQITIKQWYLTGNDRLPSTEAELLVDGIYWKQSYRHFGPKIVSSDQARKYDNRLNFLLYDGKHRLEFWEKTRSCTLLSTPALPPTALELTEHLTKTFTTSSLLRPHLDKVLDIYSTDKGIPFRCSWRSLMMPEALRLPGWVLLTTRDASSSGNLHYTREITPGLVDNLWLDPTHEFSIMRRELSFVGERPIAFEYADPLCVGDGLWLPATCRWLGLKGAAIEQKIVDLKFGAIPSSEFKFVPPPGSRIDDAVAKTTSYLPGGEVVLRDLVDRARYLHALPLDAPSSTYWTIALYTILLLIATTTLILSTFWLTRHPFRIATMQRSRPSRPGFTLIEILVVLSIIGLLIALLLPAVQDARRSAHRLQCSNNMKQIGLAIAQYDGVHSQLPTGRFDGGDGGSYKWNIYCRTVLVAILPYMDQSVLYNRYNFSLASTDLANITVEIGRPGFLVCPSDPAAAPILSAGPNSRVPYVDPLGGTYPTALTSYGLMYGTVSNIYGVFQDGAYDPHNNKNGCFTDAPTIRFADITDGASNTAFAGERAVGFLNQGRTFNIIGTWTQDLAQDILLFATYPPNAVFQHPVSPNIDSYLPSGLSSFHSGGVNLLFGDGSVHFVKNSISCWPIAFDGTPPGGAHTDSTGYFVNLPPNGVWQALTTRAGGESVGNDY